MSDNFHKAIVHAYANLHNADNVLGTPISQEHLPHILKRSREGHEQLYNKLNDAAGSFAVGGRFGNFGMDDIQKQIMKMQQQIHESQTVHRGGSFHVGGGFVPSSPEEMYQHVLHMNPYQIEMMREASAQLLGGKPSPMFPMMVTKNEPLEAPAEDYENIIQMPNAHAMGRMLEADHGHVKGGGFFSGLKHVVRKIGQFYKPASSALRFASQNSADLVGLLPQSYQGAASSFLSTAASIDAAINPMIEATIDAVQENASPEAKERLKKMAEKSIDDAVAKHLPQANGVYQAAKTVGQDYSSGGFQAVKKRGASYASTKAQELAASVLKPAGIEADIGL